MKDLYEPYRKLPQFRRSKLPMAVHREIPIYIERRGLSFQLNDLVHRPENLPTAKLWIDSILDQELTLAEKEEHF
jgi:hypothetical protein